MRRPRWCLAALFVPVSVLAASCSGSGPVATPESPPTTTTTAPAPTTTVPFQTLPPRVALGPTGQIRVNTGPVIAKVSPLSSPVGGIVTITGKRLESSTSVTFNGVKGTITARHPTRIKVLVPPGAATGYLTVTTPYGSDSLPEFVIT